MKILHVISSLDPREGGPVMALSGIARAQAAAGLQVAVVSCFTPDENLEFGDALTHAGVGMQWIGPVRGPLKRNSSLKLAVASAVANADVIHIHNVWHEVQHQAACAAVTRRVPYLIRPCGSLDPWSLRQKRLKKKLYLAWRLRKDLNRAAAIHFTADLERDLTAPLHLRAPSIVEPNGVDLSEFDHAPAPGSFRTRQGIAPNRQVVLFMSRIHHKKGLDRLVPAFSRLHNRDALLVIAGPDSDGYQPKVEKMIADAGVSDRVIFTGMLRGADRIAALADADLFVLPSYQENFGIAVVEALAAGTPVVISDQVNIYREVVAAGVGGATPMDVERLTKEMDRWLGDHTLCREAGVKARAFARERFDWAQIARRWQGHYERIIGETSVATSGPRST